MKTEYSIEEIEQMRQYLIDSRNKCLSKDFDCEGAITLSHTIALLAEVLQEQKSEKIDSKTR